MKINSNNGWDPLKDVIVGRAEHARTPDVDPSMRNFMYANNILILIHRAQIINNQQYE